MSVTSNRSVTIEFTGSVEYSQTFDAPAVSTGSGQIQSVALSSGANTITVPSGAIAVTIIPPDDNSVALTLKGVSGDTGIALALLGPSSISLASVSTFVINAASVVTVRLIYS
jgi:hypothetical protein